MFVVATKDQMVGYETEKDAFTRVEELVASYFRRTLKEYENEFDDADPGMKQYHVLQKLLSDGCGDDGIERKLAFWTSLTEQMNTFVGNSEFAIVRSDTDTTFTHHETFPDPAEYEIQMQRVVVA
jgi:hypothetical protein